MTELVYTLKLIHTYIYIINRSPGHVHLFEFIEVAEPTALL